MGGRGASSGVSVKGKKYGTEFTTLLSSGNIKFVRYNDSTSAKTPMETMTKNRVYVTINDKNKITSITYYDAENKRKKSVDINHDHEGMRPHTHEGYIHRENGTHNPTKKEKAMIERVKKLWYNRHSK